MSVIGQKSVFRGFFFWALSLFLLGMGMKLLMLQRCINPLPYFDQWEGEAIAAYVPYYEHALQLTDLFRPQNEHRIFFTRIYDLALLLLNGQWDSQLQMVGNAVIHCATIAVFAWYLASLMGKKYWPFIWLPLAIAVMSPFGWQNALWGFQSQFYFLLLFSLLTISLLSRNPLTLPWRLGLLAGICALFTMASGLLAAVAVAALAALEILKNPPDWRRHVPTFAAVAVLVIGGLLLKGPHAGGHNYARSATDFLGSLGNNLSWPTGLRPWLAPLNLFPLLLLAWVYFRSPEKNLPAERLVLGIGAWVILQSVATAYARGGGGKPPTWRYMDTLCFLLTANVLSLALLLGKYRNRLRFPLLWCALFAIWLVPCISSLWTLNTRAWKITIPIWADYQKSRVASMRAFLASNDEKVFDHPDYERLPWFYVPGLVYLLRSKDIPPILPACARYPLKLTSSNGPPSVFVPGGAKLDAPDPPGEFCLGDYSTNGAVPRGTYESAPLTSSFPYLEIPVAGNLGAPGYSLELVELASGKTRQIKPAHEPGGQWVNIDIKAPAGPFKLVARGDASSGWFAFKEPREMGRLSYWAQRTVDLGMYPFIAGCLAFALALGLYFLPAGNSDAFPGRSPKVV